MDFSKNVSFRPKAEVQSVHVLGKQFTLYCAIVEPVENRYLYHLSNDRKHGGIIVDQALRDIISAYEIQNEDLWIQSDNAPSQYKSNIPFEKESKGICTQTHERSVWSLYSYQWIVVQANLLETHKITSLNNKKF